MTNTNLAIIPFDAKNSLPAATVSLDEKESVALFVAERIPSATPLIPEEIAAVSGILFLIVSFALFRYSDIFYIWKKKDE
jgi:hypothetical protein